MTLSRQKNTYSIKTSDSQSPMTVMLFFNCCFAVLSLCLMFLPIAQGYLVGTYYRLLLILTMGGWVATTFAVNRQWLAKLLPTAGLMLLLVLFYCVFVVLRIGNIAGMVTTIVPPYYAFFVFYFYYVSGKKRELATIGMIMFAALLITLLTTISGLANDPYLYRESGGILDSAINYRKNIGNVNHVYAAVLIAALVGCVLQSKTIKNKKLKFGAWCLLAVCVYVGLTCSSAIALLCLILALVYLPLQRKPAVIQIGVVLAILILYLALSGIVADWIIALSQQIENEYISLKIQDIGLSLSGNEATGELAARTSRWMHDFDAFLGSYGLGIGSYYTGAGNGTYTVADHSQLFSDLARYGILFFAFTCILFLSYKKLIKRMMDECDVHIHLNAVYLVFIIMYVCQPIMSNYVIPMIFFFFLPAAIQIVARSNEKAV